MRQRFELSEGSSNKFWEIELSGRSFTVRFGRLGTEGQSKTKRFGSEEEARREHEALVAEKLKKGYQKVGGGKSPGKKKSAPEAASAGAKAKRPAGRAPPADPIDKAVIAARKSAHPASDEIDLDPWPGQADWTEPDFKELEKRFGMPLGETFQSLVRLVHRAKPSDPPNALWAIWFTLESLYPKMRPQRLGNKDLTPKDVLPFASERGDLSHYGVWTGGPKSLPLDQRPVVYVSKEDEPEVVAPNLELFLRGKASEVADRPEAKRAQKLLAAILPKKKSQAVTLTLAELREEAAPKPKGRAGDPVISRFRGFDMVQRLQLGPDGSSLAVLDLELRVIDFHSGAKLLTREFDPLQDLAIAPDGKLYLAVEEEIVVLDPKKKWAAVGKAKPAGLEGNFTPRIAVSGEHLALVRGNQAFVWRRMDLEQLHVLKTQEMESSASPLFTRDGKRLIVVQNGAIEVFALDTGKRVRRIAPEDHGMSIFNAADLSPAGAVSCLGSGDEAAVLQFAIDSGRLLSSWPCPDPGIGECTLRWSANGKRLALVGEGIRVWNADGAVLAEVPAGDPGEASSEYSGLAITPDGSQLAVGYRETSIKVFDLERLVAKGVGKSGKPRRAG